MQAAEIVCGYLRISVLLREVRILYGSFKAASRFAYNACYADRCSLGDSRGVLSFDRTIVRSIVLGDLQRARRRADTPPSLILPEDGMDESSIEIRRSGTTQLTGEPNGVASRTPAAVSLALSRHTSVDGLSPVLSPVRCVSCSV